MPIDRQRLACLTSLLRFFSNTEFLLIHFHVQMIRTMHTLEHHPFTSLTSLEETSKRGSGSLLVNPAVNWVL